MEYYLKKKALRETKAFRNLLKHSIICSNHVFKLQFFLAVELLHTFKFFGKRTLSGETHNVMKPRGTWQRTKLRKSLLY